MPIHDALADGEAHPAALEALARREAQIVLERLLVRSTADWALAGTPRWQKRNPTIRAHDSPPLVRAGSR